MLTDKFFSTQKSLLETFGLWPRLNSSLSYKSMKILSLASYYLLGLTMYIQAITSIFHGNLVGLMEVFFICIAMTTYLTRITSFVSKEDIFFEIEEHLRNDNKYLVGKEECFEGVYRASRILKYMLYGIIFISQTVFTIFPLIAGVLPLPFPYFQEGFMHHVLHAYQVIVLNIVGATSISFDLTCTSLMQVVCVHFDVLKNRLETMDMLNEEDAVEVLKECGLRYFRITKLVRDVENLLGKGYFVQVASSLTVICITGFNLVVISPASAQGAYMVVYIFLIATQVFVPCWCGNEIILKNSEIGLSCYKSNWHQTKNGKIKTMLLILMDFSGKELKINTYKLGYLSLATFTFIINGSYSYYNLLRRLYASSQVK